MARKAIIEKRKKEPKHETRVYARHRIYGRPRSVLRKFDICRTCFRELAYKGQILGCKKVGW